MRTTGGYARVRSQFRTPIGRFEGIEEALAVVPVFELEAAPAVLLVSRTPPPPALTSSAYTTAYDEAKRLGGDGIDDGEGERLQPCHVVIETPLVQQRRVRVDADAEPAAGGHRVVEEIAPAGGEIVEIGVVPLDAARPLARAYPSAM